jgi:hypothetical protein
MKTTALIAWAKTYNILCTDIKASTGTSSARAFDQESFFGLSMKHAALYVILAFNRDFDCEYS